MTTALLTAGPDMHPIGVQIWESEIRPRFRGTSKFRTRKTFRRMEGAVLMVCRCLMSLCHGAPVPLWEPLWDSCDPSTGGSTRFTGHRSAAASLDPTLLDLMCRQQLHVTSRTPINTSITVLVNLAQYCGGNSADLQQERQRLPPQNTVPAITSTPCPIPCHNPQCTPRPLA